MSPQFLNYPKLLTFADLIVPGAKQINPHAEQAHQMTKQLCQKYGISLPHIDEYSTVTAYIFPNSSIERLVTINLWVDLLFFIDDFYDRNINHTYSNETEKYQNILENTLRIICDGYQPETEHLFYPVAYELNRRFQELAMPESIERFRATILKHLKSLQSGINDLFDDRGVMSVTKYMQLREADSGVEIMISMIEVALDILIPNEVLHHPQLQRLTQLTTRFFGFSNDLFSYEKEVLRLGSRFNLIAVLMEAEQLSFAEAVHKTIVLINREAVEFFELESNLPVWEEPPFNEAARLYATGLKDQIIAAYHWSYSTNRYRSPNSPFPELRPML